MHGEATITAKTPVEKLENKEELFVELPNLVNERPKFISKRSTKPIIIISDDKLKLHMVIGVEIPNLSFHR